MIAYLDIPSGISGDIFLGCLLDLGWPLEHLRSAIGSLKLPEDSWDIQARTVMKGPLRATQALVTVAETSAHRHLADIRSMIESSDLPLIVRQQAIATFTRLAQAEARVHGTTIDQIHFHEVGALDAIIDIVGTCCGLNDLGIKALAIGAFPLGPGWTKSEHGLIPLAAPATLELLAEAGAPIVAAPIGAGELVTPTGAALAVQWAAGRFGVPSMQLKQIGIGSGARDFPWPNVARLWLGQSASSSSDGGSRMTRDLVEIQTNLDDMNPQLYQAVSQKLFDLGAKDVWLTPIQMKKNRPGILLSALGESSEQSQLAQAMLRETSTLGVRMHAVSRIEADRGFSRIETPWGMVSVKLKKLDGQIIAAVPEYEEVAKLAQVANVPVKDVMDVASAMAVKLVHANR